MRRSISFVLIVLALASSGCTRSPEERKQRALDRGKRLLQSKDYPRAILEFKNAAQVGPNDPETHYQLALAYVGTQDLRSAVVSLRRATELNPAHADAQIRLAEILAATRDTDMLKDAAHRMETVLGSSPNNPDALRTLAYAEFGLGERDEAEKHLAEAVDNGPTNLRSAVSLAQLRVTQKKFGEAEEILRKATNQKPAAATPFIVLGEFYLSTNKPVEAKREFQRALEIEKDNPVALLYLGRVQIKAGETEEAAKTFKYVSALPDKRLKAVYATFLFESGKPDQAIQELEKVAAANPQDRTLRRRLVSMYLATGRTADAGRMLNAALKKNQKDTDALLGRSSILIATGKYEEASGDLNQVLRYEPNSAEAHYLLARVHELRGNEKSRRQELTEVVRLAPEMLGARIELSRVLMASDAKTAVELMNDMPEWQKRNSAAIAQRNWALFASGNKREMAVGVADGLTVARTTDLLLQDAALKLDRQDLTGARAVLDEILQKDPEDTRAMEMLVQTYVPQNQLAVASRRIREHAAAHPKSATIQHFLGTLLQRNGSPGEARVAFTAAKAANSSFWLADLSLASLDVAENKLDAARSLLLPLLSQQGAGLRARLLLAAAEEKSGNRMAALEHYRKILDQQPDNVLVLNNLAYGLVEYAHSPDEALKVAARAKELAPDNATVDDTLGWVYCRKGLYANALPHLENSVKREPNATRLAHLAIAYANRGDTTRALEQLQAAMRLNPRIPEVAEAQKVLAAAR